MLLKVLRGVAIVLGAAVLVLATTNALAYRNLTELDIIAHKLGGRPNSIVILHLEKPENGDIQGYQWWDNNGVPHIMVRPPYSSLDVGFLCMFNHEYAHVQLGFWHGNEANSTCGPDIPETELEY